MNPFTAPRFEGDTGYLPSSNGVSLLAPFDPLEKQASKSILALAHEIRNPLSCIKMAGQMLETEADNGCRGKYLDVILRNSDRINDIVSDLLIAFRSNGTQKGLYSMQELLDEVISLNKDRITLRNISVIRYYRAPDCKIEINRPGMKIALTNLIVNATEAMLPGMGRLKLTTKSTENKYIIEIEDNGKGISKTNLKAIFNPYFTDKPGGMGVGLFTAMDILHSNHAQTFVHSEEGIGTRFVLSFEMRTSSNRGGFEVSAQR